MSAKQHGMFAEAYTLCLPYCSRWRQAAVSLKFTSYDIERINRDESREQDRLLALLSEWIARNPNGTMEDVRKAIFVATSSYNSLKTDNRKLSIHPCMTILLHYGAPILLIAILLGLCAFSLSEVFPINQTYLNQTTIMVKKEIIETIDATNDKFLRLFSEMQVQLNQQVSGNPQTLESLHRFLCGKFTVPYDASIGNQADHIDYLFQRFRQYYNYMDTSLLSSLDKQFLGGYFEKNISVYHNSVNMFLNSTPISELTNKVWHLHRQFNYGTEVVLKLGKYWNNRNLENLENLKKHVFGDDAALLVLIKIHHSILTIIYALPIELTSSVTSKASQPENTHQLKLAGACAIEVNSSVTLNFINDTDEQSSISEPMEMSLVLFNIIMNATAASKVGDIPFIMDIGADIDYDNGTYTPLGLAVTVGNIPVVLELIKLNSDINKASVGSGNFPLSLASLNGQLKMVEILLANKANVSKPFLHGNNALHLAALNNHTSILRLLLFHTSDPNIKNSYNSTPLHIASYQGHYKPCQILLESLSDINAVDSCGLTPLMVASIKDHPSVVDLLLRYGSDITPTFNDTGYNSLHLSTVLGHSECVMKHVLQQNINLNSQTIYGVSALHLAAFNGHEQLVKALIEAGADVNIQTPVNNESPDNNAFQEHIGITPLMVTSDKNIVKLLLYHGANPSTGIWSTLNLAVYYGGEDIVEVLLEHGAMDNHTRGAVSPLSIAAAMIGDPNSWNIMNMLLRYGDINNKDPYFDGATPLMLAIIHGNTEIVQLLLELGSDIEVLNKYDETAVDLAGKVLTQQFGFDWLQLIKSRQALKIWKIVIEKHEETSSLVMDSLSVVDTVTADIIANKTLYHTDQSQQLAAEVYTPISHLVSSSRRARHEVFTGYYHDDVSVYELVYTVKYLIPKCTNKSTMVLLQAWFDLMSVFNSFNTKRTNLMPPISTSIGCYDDMIQ